MWRLALVALCGLALTGSETTPAESCSTAPSGELAACMLQTGGSRAGARATIEEEPSPAACVEAVLVEPRKLASISTALESAALANVSDEPLRRIDLLTVAHGSLNGAYVRQLVLSSGVLAEAERSGRLRFRSLDTGDLGGDLLQESAEAKELAEELAEALGQQSSAEPAGPSSLLQVQYHDRYSRVLKSKEFWKGFVCDRVLLMQSDSTMCHNSKVRLSEFLDFDYVGGHTPKLGGQAYGGRLHMNGGFSFRNRNSMLRCLQGDVPEEGGEDGFFSACAELQQPPVSVIDRFAIDNALKPMNPESVPLGVHKPWAGSPENTNMQFCAGARELLASMNE